VSPIAFGGDTLNRTDRILDHRCRNSEKYGAVIFTVTEQLPSLDLLELLYTSVLNPTGPCRASVTGTTKDGSGLALTLGTFHIVLVPPHGSLGILFLLQPPEAHVLAFIINEYTALTSLLKGSAGVPEVTEYLNQGGTIVGARLALAFGSDLREAAESVEKGSDGYGVGR
jgi:hypothetical protein